MWGPAGAERLPVGATKTEGAQGTGTPVLRVRLLTGPAVTRRRPPQATGTEKTGSNRSDRRGCRRVYRPRYGTRETPLSGCWHARTELPRRQFAGCESYCRLGGLGPGLLGAHAGCQCRSGDKQGRKTPSCTRTNGNFGVSTRSVEAEAEEDRADGELSHGGRPSCLSATTRLGRTNGRARPKDTH